MFRLGHAQYNRNKQSKVLNQQSVIINSRRWSHSKNECGWPKASNMRLTNMPDMKYLVIRKYVGK